MNNKITVMASDSHTRIRDLRNGKYVFRFVIVRYFRIRALFSPCMYIYVRCFETISPLCVWLLAAFLLFAQKCALLLYERKMYSTAPVASSGCATKITRKQRITKKMYGEHGEIARDWIRSGMAAQQRKRTDKSNFTSVLDEIFILNVLHYTKANNSHLATHTRSHVRTSRR